MQGGDISNGTPPKFLVNLNVVVIQQTTVTKKFLRKPVEEEVDIIDHIMLNVLFRFADRYSCTLDVFAVGMPQKELDALMDKMDATVVNPFRHGVVYRDIHELLTSLPYRVDVMGVIDLPGNALRYGSKYYDISQVPLGG